MANSFINNLTPAPTKGELFQNNYITDFDFANQFLPDVYEKQAEIYGNRSIGSFLRLVSAEMPSASDEIRWVEQGRLHVRYDNVGVTGNTFTVTLPTGVDKAAVRVGQTIMAQGLTSADVATGGVLKGVVTAVHASNNTFTAICYTAATWGTVASADHATVLVYRIQLLY